ncbi:MAG: hypothetical protein AB7J19_17100, partial [Beijerinckiaceae bacterium]
GWGGPKLAESYEAERRPVGWRNVGMATKFYESHLEFDQRLSSIEDDTAEGAAMRADAGPKMTQQVAKMFRTTGLQLGYRYDGSPICVDDASPAIPDDPEHMQPSARPGARAPHAWLDDRRSILDLFGKELVLLRLGPDAPDPAGFAEAARDIGAPLSVHAIANPGIETLYERKLVLVRPDGHVAWRGDEVPADPKAALRKICGW